MVIINGRCQTRQVQLCMYRRGQNEEHLLSRSVYVLTQVLTKQVPPYLNVLT